MRASRDPTNPATMDDAITAVIKMNVYCTASMCMNVAIISAAHLHCLSSVAFVITSYGYSVRHGLQQSDGIMHYTYCGMIVCEQ